MRHLGHEAQDSLHRSWGAFFRTGWDGQAERERVDLLEVKGSDEHPAKGFDGSRRDRRRDAASGLLGSGR